MNSFTSLIVSSDFKNFTNKDSNWFQWILWKEFLHFNSNLNLAHSNKQSMQIYLGCKQIKSRQTSIEAKPIIVIISVIMCIQYSRNSNLTELQQCSKHRQHSKMSYLSDDSIISLLIFYHHVCICQWSIGIHLTWHGICLHRLTVCTMDVWALCWVCEPFKKSISFIEWFKLCQLIAAAGNHIWIQRNFKHVKTFICNHNYRLMSIIAIKYL